MKSAFGCFGILQLVLGILALLGWVQCLIKFIDCDFKAPYKAEVIYGVGTVTGLGAVIGWINIEDTPEKTETLEKLK